MLLTHQRQKSFRLTLAEQLVGSYNSRKQLGRPQSSQAHAPLTMASPSTSSCRTPLHLPSRLQGRRCAYCAECRQPPRRRDVLWCCKACTFEPPLCLTVGRLFLMFLLLPSCRRWLSVPDVPAATLLPPLVRQFLMFPVCS